MADERDNEQFSEQDGGGGGDQSHPKSKGREGSFGGQSPGQGSSDGMGGQPIGGDDSNTGSGTTLTQGADFGGQSATGQAQPSSGSEPPRSMGTHGTEFGQMSDYDRSGQQGQSGTGQADLGTQSDATLSGHTDQQDFGTDQPGSVAGATGRQDEGFMARQPAGSSSSADATSGSDFAREGRGALDEDDESESGKSEHSAFTSGTDSGRD
ncbi:MAG TPA: hypothetical protein VNS11_09225 [Sphingomicrobium sp.]|nr:hypothetical protein [Sphingomicrobium sp.]